MKDELLLGIALENLKEKTGIVAKGKTQKRNGLDGELQLHIGGKWLKYFIELKAEVREHQLGRLYEMARKHKPLMVVAQRIFPAVKEKLRQQKIAYLEANGNLYLKQPGTHIWLDGNRTLAAEKEKPNRAFNKTGLKVVFEFLLDESAASLPYRDIAVKANVGLGNINYVITGLKKMGFLFRGKDHLYKLVNKKELLQKWIAAYIDKLKPTLLIGKFRFLKEQDFAHWEKINLQAMNTWWGGEPAGAILTRYLRPARLTMYTNEAREKLIRYYRLVPDEMGNIDIYKRFSGTDKLNYDYAPPLLVYADLIGTGEPRCIETAKKLYDEQLADKF